VYETFKTVDSLTGVDDFLKGVDVFTGGVANALAGVGVFIDGVARRAEGVGDCLNGAGDSDHDVVDWFAEVR